MKLLSRFVWPSRRRTPATPTLYCGRDHSPGAPVTHDWFVTAPPGYGSIFSPCNDGYAPGIAIEQTPEASIRARRIRRGKQ